MSYQRDMLEHCPVWRHVKTGGLYHVVGTAVCSTNGSEGAECVVYFSMTYQAWRYREIGEFLDGRFVPEPPAEPKGP